MRVPNCTLLAGLGRQNGPEGEGYACKEHWKAHAMQRGSASRTDRHAAWRSDGGINRTANMKMRNKDAGLRPSNVKEGQ